MNRRITLKRGLIGLVLISLIGVTAVIVLQNRAKAIPDTTQISQAIARSIQLSTIDGQTIDLPSNSGQVTVLYTMGYWCATCIPGAKTLARLQGEYAPRGVRFIAVDVSPQVTVPDLQPFLQAVGDNHLTWAMDASGRFAHLYQINALDTAIILDGQGREVYR